MPGIASTASYVLNHLMGRTGFLRAIRIAATAVVTATISAYRLLFETQWRWATLSATLFIFVFSASYPPRSDTTSVRSSHFEMPSHHDIAEEIQETELRARRTENKIQQIEKCARTPQNLQCEFAWTINGLVLGLTKSHMSDEERIAVLADDARNAIRVVQIKKAMLKLAGGSFIYNRITTMWRDLPETVILKLSLASEPPPTISDTLRGTSIMGITPLAPEMSVGLDGTAGLEVTPDEPIRKRISDLAPTTWQWKVTPKMAEDQLLTLSIFIHVDDKDPFTLKTFEDKIQVKVTSWQQTKDVVSFISPVWAFAAGAIPLLWGGYMWMRGRKWRPHKETE